MRSSGRHRAVECPSIDRALGSEPFEELSLLIGELLIGEDALGVQRSQLGDLISHIVGGRRAGLADWMAPIS